MYKSRFFFWFKSMLLTMLVVLGIVTMASTALAFGSFQLKRTTVEEVDGRWKFDVEVNYGSKPHLGHIPFDFIFVQKVYYEYSITDSDPKPVQRRKPMQNQPPQREQMDIGFSDARGETWQKTKFSFSVRRDRGFSAGEYTLTVKRSSDGQSLGRPMTIILDGQNELIDRRAIVFSGESKKKKTEETKEASQDEGKQEAKEAEEPEDTVPEYVDDEPSVGPPPVDKKAKSGCGCRTAGLDTHAAGSGSLSLLLLGMGFWLRRRSRA